MLRRIVKPKTQRGKRALKQKEPQIHENVKTSMFIRGGNTSQCITCVLKELHMLRRPNSVIFQKKNVTRPFEDQTSIEFFSDKNDASLFGFGSHSKKRPNNLVLGRLFDHQVLDMVEFGVEKFKSMFEFEGSKAVMGSKPCLLFAGEEFEGTNERIKSLLIDFFRGEVTDNVRLNGLECVMTFTAIEGKVLLRTYRPLLKKSGSKTPRIELKEIGPSMDLIVRRQHFASDDLFKQALKQPKEAKPKKKKNISHDPFGTKLGRIHMTPQDLGKLQTRKMKGLKTRKRTSDDESERGPAKKSRV